MSAPDIGEREHQLVQRVLSSGTLSGGMAVEDFENRIRTHLGIKHGVAVSSGTGGLHTSVIAAGIRPGDEVVTTPFSFVASVNCILYEGGSPVLADIDPITLNIDPANLERCITAKTRGVVAVHVFGHPVDMDPILDIARRHGLFVIEDACEALGAEYKGRPVGTLGDAAVFAFYPNKQITTAEGGIVVTDRDDIASAVRSLRNQGRDPGDAWLRHSRLGFNYRLSDLHAAVGIAQMERLQTLLEKRARVAAAYSACLSQDPRFELPHVASYVTRMTWFVYVIRLQEDIDRDRVIVGLNERGIPARPYFPPIHLQPYFNHRGLYAEGSLPVAEHEAGRTLALPFHGGLSDSQVEFVCGQLRQVVDTATRPGKAMTGS